MSMVYICNVANPSFDHQQRYWDAYMQQKAGTIPAQEPLGLPDWGEQFQPSRQSHIPSPLPQQRQTPASQGTPEPLGLPEWDWSKQR